eukprot:TRINITY_DN2040_c0_g1_i2.p1 TRINITY_DN2040_c0_g1~~TRINITY_DN2040_c0_g1_i2.p1  ORF type:complete len:350 (-),score=90.15 TRINITY_DN2040_c0_g1_i2:236-1213(-)
MADGIRKDLPFGTAFKQQRLPSCQPILTPKIVITTLFTIGILFIIIGIVLLHASDSVVETTVRYDNIDECAIGKTCAIEFEIPEKMESPVYLYYKLENFYQNHRRYVRSRNDNQLRGKVITSFGAIEICDPKESAGGSHDYENFYVPCGLIAFSVFNDSITLQNADTQEEIYLDKSGIAWKSDRDEKFKNPDEIVGIDLFDNSTGGLYDPNQFPDKIEDEDFIVWMRTAGLPTFRKLYRKINQTLDKGQKVQATIVNQFPVSQFSGKKYLVLSTTSWMGGKNPFLGVSYLVVGIVCFLLAILFLVLHKLKPRPLGDLKYLDWNKN